MKKKKELIIEWFMIFFGTVLMNIGFYFFFLSNNFVTGGVSGVAVILSIFNIKASYTILALNVLFFIIGYFVMGKKFALKTTFGTLFSPLVIFIIEFLEVPSAIFVDQLREAPLLISMLLGTIATGVGIGVIFRNGGSTGGIDIIQTILRRKLHLNYSIVFLLTDGLIVLFGFLVIKDIQLFVYAVASILLFSYLVDNLSIAGKAGHTLFIVTQKASKIKTAIYERIDRGTTIVDAKGGYSGTKKQLVICVIHKRQLNLTRVIVEKTDPEAFTFIAQTKEAVGRGFSRD